MQLSPTMLKTLRALQVGKTTAFGYTQDTGGATYINGNSVKALIRRGLLEQCGEMPWQTYMEDNQMKGHFVPVYRISEIGRSEVNRKGAA